MENLPTQLVQWLTLIFIIIGICIAWINIKTYKKFEKLKATFSFIDKTFSGKISIEGTKTIKKLVDKREEINGQTLAEIESYGLKDDNPHSKKYSKEQIEEFFNEAQHLFSYLNIFERFSLAVEKDLLDEATCRQCVGTKLTRTWTEVESFVKEARKLKNHDNMYKKMEELHYKWIS